MLPRRPAARRRNLAVGGLGLAAAAYVGVDYLRYLLPAWHARLQPALWASLALATAARAPFYRSWDAELRAAPRFLAAMAFMLAVFLCEAISVRFVSTVLGLQWHRRRRCEWCGDARGRCGSSSSPPSPRRCSSSSPAHSTSGPVAPPSHSSQAVRYLSQIIPMMLSLQRELPTQL